MWCRWKVFSVQVASFFECQIPLQTGRSGFAPAMLTHWYYIISQPHSLQLYSCFPSTRISAPLRLFSWRSRHCSSMEENIGVCWHKDLAHECSRDAFWFGFLFSKNWRFHLYIVCSLHSLTQWCSIYLPVQELRNRGATLQLLRFSIKAGTPKSFIFKWIFRCKPSIWGHPHLWKSTIMLGPVQGLLTVHGAQMLGAQLWQRQPLSLTYSSLTQSLTTQKVVWCKI